MTLRARKGGVLATKVVETLGKGSVLPAGAIRLTERGHDVVPFGEAVDRYPAFRPAEKADLLQRLRAAFHRDLPRLLARVVRRLAASQGKGLP